MTNLKWPMSGNAFLLDWFMFVCFYACGWADGAVVHSVVNALHVLYSTETDGRWPQDMSHLQDLHKVILGL